MAKKTKEEVVLSAPSICNKLKIVERTRDSIERNFKKEKYTYLEWIKNLKSRGFL